jgi:signal peptidase II
VALGANSLSKQGFFRKGTLLFLGSTLAVIALDQWTKSLARTYLLGVDGNGPRSIRLFDTFFRLTYVENRGAAFGLLQDQTAFFILVGVVVIGVIVASHRQIANPHWTLDLCLGLQMGGALGNLVDRIRYGYVVDFFDLTVWPVFNVADSAICVGVAVLAWNLMFPRSEPEQPTQQA